MNKYNFKNAKFFTTVNDIQALPKVSVQEIAIVGRSNAGKSSLLNTLTNQKKLAFTSKTPGRTQHINYFDVYNNEIFIVDLPGYGYAQVPEKIRTHWVALLGTYLAQREPLSALILIMDIRHPLKELDIKMLNFFKVRDKHIHIVLSKSDKLNISDKTKSLKLVEKYLQQNNFTKYSIQLFSSLNKTGVTELEDMLNSILNVTQNNK